MGYVLAVGGLIGRILAKLLHVEATLLGLCPNRDFGSRKRCISPPLGE